MTYFQLTHIATGRIYSIRSEAENLADFKTEFDAATNSYYGADGETLFPRGLIETCLIKLSPQQPEEIAP